MKLKSELINAVELFLLLSLLFWSFTWNSSVYFDFSRSSIPADGIRKSPRDAKYAKRDVRAFTNQHSVLKEYFSEIGHESGKTPNAAIFIPPFNEWKEKEMTKHGSSECVDPRHHHHQNKNGKNPSPRKLNYASSKCGAKVLASNPEARYRIAVLSDKPDDYMLNPCRAKRWFIVELCDTVEATQFELANYELYSSSPREFSLFWSEVYPTTEWHLLGNFEAKDQRTMQTFDLTTKNLGKFIKVVIYNHHGREHYCPLSVIRVLGYSMVQNFEDIETSEGRANRATGDISATQTDEIADSKKEQLATKDFAALNRVSGTNSSMFSAKICKFFFMHCTHSSTPGDRLCANEPKCRFLAEVILKFPATNCREIFCPKASGNHSENDSAIYGGRLEADVNPSNASIRDTGRTKSVNESGSIDGNVLKTDNQKKLPEVLKNCSDFASGESHGEKKSSLDSRKENTTKSNTRGENTRPEEVLRPVEDSPCPSAAESREKWMHAKESKENASANDNSSQVNEGTVESAGLIHTELTARIKASEKDLNLINKYLQQLSQSYREQMADMKAMFDQTLKAINIQSEKSKVIHKKQDESIKVLERTTRELSLKIDFLMSGRKDLLKRVVELHGFFLILELIILSTIFTIFLNIFHRKSGSMTRDRMKINYFGTVHK